MFSCVADLLRIFFWFCLLFVSLIGANNESTITAQKQQQTLSQPLPLLFDINEIGKVLLQKVMTANSSSRCAQELQLIALASLRHETWAMKFIDSSQPLKPSGWLSGKLKWFGDFDQCLSIGRIEVANNTRTISPKFCQIAIDTPSNATSSPETLLNLSQRPVLKLGVCLPSSCLVDDLEGLINPLLSGQNITIRKEFSHCKVEEVPFTNEFFIAVIIFSVIGAILLVSFLVEIVAEFADWLLGAQRQWKVIENGNDSFVNITANITASSNDSAYSVSILSPTSSPPMGPIKSSSALPCDEQKLKAVAMACSPYANFRRIVKFPTVTDDDANSANLTGLNGIRALSLLWIILGHVYLFTSIDIPATVKDRKSFMFLSTGTIHVVDTYLFLSGFLAYWSLAPKFNKASTTTSITKSVILSWINRYIRLTPPYAAAILLVVGFWPYIGNGPDYLQTVDEHCKANWWTNLLYVNNFVGTREPCLPWSWYLAVDMQLSLLAPFLIFAFIRKPVLGWLLSATGLVSHIAVASMLTIKYNLPVSLIQPNFVINDEFLEKIYLPFYTRMGPYIVGVACCHLVVTWSAELRRRVFNASRLWLQAFLWLLMFAVMLTLIYAPYGIFAGKYVDPAYADAMYNSLTDIAWGLAMSWLVLAVVFRKASLIGDILEWPGWVVPARLSYVAYLIHPLIIFYYLQTQRQPIEWTTLVNIFFFLAVSAASLILAIPFSLFFESPFVAIQKIFLKKK